MPRLHSDGHAEHVTIEIVEAVANEIGQDTRTLSTPLYEAVDPDALARLLESDALTTVSFEYEGHRVEIDGDGTITVTAPEEVIDR